MGFLMLLGCSSKNTSQHEIAKPLEPTVAEVIAKNLKVVWGMDILPDGRLIFNEREGRISILNIETKEVKLLMEREIWDRAEGGLLGLAVDPQFTTNHYLFIYETAESGNRIVRLIFENEILIEDKILVDNIQKKMFHDGGILKFGPDGYLYAGTGDAREPNSAQDKNNLSGKILKMDRDGNAATDNPFKNLVYSYGHRNVQGLCWDENGNMFSSEHGPSGELNGWCCHDELNLIIKGGNYGWPEVIGDDEIAGKEFILPISHSGIDTWAPGGIINIKGKNKILMACLRGEKLIQFNYQSDKNIISSSIDKVYFNGDKGRLRNIIQLPDGSIIFCSSNRDGRGDPDEEDDRIYKMKFEF